MNGCDTHLTYQIFGSLISSDIIARKLLTKAKIIIDQINFCWLVFFSRKLFRRLRMLNWKQIVLSVIDVINLLQWLQERHDRTVPKWKKNEQRPKRFLVCVHFVRGESDFKRGEEAHSSFKKLAVL